MKYRRKMKKRESKRNFKKKSGTHPKNRTRMTYRGGVRL